MDEVQLNNMRSKIIEKVYNNNNYAKSIINYILLMQRCKVFYESKECTERV
jgi:hypothetical protein